MERNVSVEDLALVGAWLLYQWDSHQELPGAGGRWEEGGTGSDLSFWGSTWGKEYMFSYLQLFP